MALLKNAKDDICNSGIHLLSHLLLRTEYNMDVTIHICLHIRGYVV